MPISAEAKCGRGTAPYSEVEAEGGECYKDRMSQHIDIFETAKMAASKAKEPNPYWRVTGLSLEATLHLASNECIENFERNPRSGDTTFKPGSPAVLDFLYRAIGPGQAISRADGMMCFSKEYCKIAGIGDAAKHGTSEEPLDDDVATLAREITEALRLGQKDADFSGNAVISGEATDAIFGVLIDGQFNLMAAARHLIFEGKWRKMQPYTLLHGITKDV